MFIENKYKKCYDRIIKAAMNRDIGGYTEKHHILPKSLGGANDATNLVALTAREHYVCHWLLTKFIEETYYRKKMENALGRFVQQSKLQSRNLTSRQFERARKAVSEANTGRFYSVETRARMSELAKGRTPWNKGLTGAQQYTEENKEALRALYTGKSFEDRFGHKAKDIKARMSEGKKGHTAGMTGKTHSLSTRAKMSQNMKGKRGPQKRIANCPNCNKENVTVRHIKFCTNQRKTSNL